MMMTIEDYTFVEEKDHTVVYDCDGEAVLTFPLGIGTTVVCKTIVEAFAAGMARGIKHGEISKQMEIRRALGIYS